MDAAAESRTLPELNSYQHHFALFTMSAGAVSSSAIIALVLLTGHGPLVLPGVAFGTLGCLAGLALAQVGRLEVGIRVMLWSSALGVWPACALEPSGEGALAGPLSWLLLGIFASIVLPFGEMVALGAACTLGTATLIAYIDALDVAPELYPAGLVGMVFVPTGFATLAQIAVYVRTTFQRLRQAEQEARDALQARGQFLANMSHELRTPLNAILGYSEILMEDADADSLLDLERIHRSGTNLLGHINALLDLSKLEAGRMEVFLEPVELNALVAGIVAEQAPLLTERGNRVELELEPGLSATTDRGKLEQILSNLLSNANKFTEHGSIVIRGRQEEGGQTLQVVDTGVGIARDALEHIFQPFMQADSSTTRTYGGTGLGLTLVSQFTTLLGGRVRVESEEGVGTTFSVWLPKHSGAMGPTSVA